MGLRAKAAGARHDTIESDDQHTPGPRLARRRWAALIKQVWRVDPLVCARCGERLRIVAFIKPTQHAVIEKLLRHRSLWEESPRAPPPDERAAPRPPDPGELSYVSDLEYVDQPAPPEPVWIPR